MLSFSQQVLPCSELEARMQNPDAGALVTFVGRVRRVNHNKPVECLFYQAHESLASAEFAAIVCEAKAQFHILDIRCVHRLGKLQVGEAAVWMGVLAPHRKDAFAACEFLMDELKKRVPIWKQEIYRDGSSVWGAPCHGSLNFSRQIQLPEFGVNGQEKLAQARVLVVGAGGLGCAALTYLAAAGIGTIGICDGDHVEASNLHRQPLYTLSDVGKHKADVAKRAIQQLNPDLRVEVYNEHLSQSNIQLILGHSDLILDCVDDWNTKLLMNDSALSLKIPVIHASLYQWQAQIYSSCMRCLWPEAESAAPQTCTDGGVLGAVAGTVGAWQASLAIQHLIGLQTKPVMHLLDFKTGHFRQLATC